MVGILKVESEQMMLVGTVANRLVNVGMLLILALGAGCSATKTNSAMPVKASKQHNADEREVVELGIRIEGLVLSSAGYMLDLRYRVVDSAKASSLMDKKIKPYLVVEATGRRIDIPDTPKLGLLRQIPKNTTVLPEREYFIMFANPGQALHSGDKVSMVIGNTRIEGLGVQ
jgi:hypothetical protein